MTDRDRVLDAPFDSLQHHPEQFRGITMEDVTALRELRTENAKLREQLHDAHAMVQAIKETPWVWVGDGTDDLHGMSYEAGITILAGQLRTLLAVVEDAPATRAGYDERGFCSNCGTACGEP